MALSHKDLAGFPEGCALSITQALNIAAARLSAAGVESPRRESRLLLNYAVDLSPEDLIRDPDLMLSQDDVSRFVAVIRRRERREPFARIVGRREFWGLDFQINDSTLIPRPDSETIITLALSAITEHETEKHILDLGTGTGCLLLAFLHERPQAKGLGIDISEEALAMAKINAEKLGLSAQAKFQKNNFMQQGWASQIGAKADLILCNPPYITTTDIAGLDPEVRCCEPLRALDGGNDGLACYKSILQELPVVLAEGGRAIFEIGQGQAPAVTSLAESCNLQVYQEGYDLSGHKRALVMRLEARA
jgi:release factor glutamine methyltransferase